MKKIILTLGICIVSLIGVQAQQSDAKTAPTLDQRVDKMMTSLTSTCSLTPDQVTKLKPIVTEAISEKMANKQKYGSDKDKLKQANQALLKESNAKINAVLNADQQSKFAAFEQEKKSEMQKKINANTTGGNQK